MRRKASITLFVLLGLPLVMVLVGWYLLGNEAFLKQQLQNLVLRQTGRSLEMTGPLSITLGSTTRIQAQDIGLGNAPWAADPYLLQIERFDLSLDLWSFFGDEPVIHSLEANNCRVDLAENADGANNWNLWADSLATDGAVDDAGEERKHYRLGRLQLDTCRISHSAPERSEPLLVAIARLSLDGDEAGQYSGEVSGEIDGLPMSVSGQFGPVQSIWWGGPFEHDLDANAGKVTLHSKGSFTDIRTGKGANVVLKFTGPEFAKVTEYFALSPFSSDAFDFSLDLNTHGAATSVDLDGDLGSFEITALGTVDRILRPTSGSLSVTTKGPDLQSLGQLFGFDGLVNMPFELSLVSAIENGIAQLAPAVLQTEKDRIEVHGALGLVTDMQGSSLKMDIRTDEIGRWANLWGRPLNTLGPLSATGQLDIDTVGVMSVQGELHYGASKLQLNGAVGSLDFDLSTPDASKLSAITHIKGLPAAALAAKGHFAREDGGIQFTSVTGSLANNQFEFSGFLSRGNQLKGSTFNVSVKAPSAAALGSLFGYQDLPDESLQLAAFLVPAGQGLDFALREGLLGDKQFALKGHIADVNHPEFFTADGSIKLPSLKLLHAVVPEAKLPDLPVSFSGGIGREPGIVRFRQAHFVLGESTVDLDGQLGVGVSAGSSSLKMSGSGPDLSQLLDAGVLASLPKTFVFSGQLSRPGASSGAGRDTLLQNFQLQLGDMKLVLDGTVDALPNPKETALQLKLSAPDASVLNTLTEVDFASVPLSVEALYRGSLQSFSLDKVVAEFGASEAQGDLQVSLGENGMVSGTLQSGFLDLKPWRDHLKKKQLEPDTAPASKDAPHEARMFPDEPVMEVGPTALDMDLDIRVDRIDLDNAEVRDVHLGILLTDHQLSLNPFELSDATGSRVSAQFMLDGTVGTPTMSLTLNGENLRIGLAAAPGQDLSTYPPAEVFADLRGSGKSWRQLAGSVNGKVRFYQGSGLVQTAAFDTFYADFLTRLLGAGDLSSENRAYTRFDCGVFAADVVAGQVKVDPIVKRTEHVTLLSVGTIDLETEKIDFNFHTKPRTGLGINAGIVINQFIKVGGTLKHPVTEFNPAGAVIGGGTAVATLGLSYVAKSFFDRFLSSKDPCGDARKRLEKADATEQDRAK